MVKHFIPDLSESYHARNQQTKDGLFLVIKSPTTGISATCFYHYDEEEQECIKKVMRFKAEDTHINAQMDIQHQKVRGVFKTDKNANDHLKFAEYEDKVMLQGLSISKGSQEVLL